MANSNLPAVGLFRTLLKRLRAVSIQAHTQQQSRDHQWSRALAQGSPQFVGIYCGSAGLAGGLRTQSAVSPPALHFPPEPTSQMAGREAGWAWQRTSAQGDLKRGCYCFSLLEQSRAARAQVASSQSSSIRNLTDYMYYRLRNNYIPNINIIQS